MGTNRVLLYVSLFDAARFFDYSMLVSFFLNKNFLDPKLPSFDGQLFKSIKKYTFKCMYELDFNLIFIEKKKSKIFKCDIRDLRRK